SFTGGLIGLQKNERNFWTRQTGPPPNLSSLPVARRRWGHALPPMRRELEILSRGSQPLAGRLDAGAVSRYVWNPGAELRILRHQFAGHPSHNRLRVTERRRALWPFQLWRYQWQGATTLRCLAAAAVQPCAAVAIRHGDFSSRQYSAHFFQYVGVDGYWPANRRAVRIGALLLHLHCHRDWRICGELHDRPHEHRGIRCAAWADRRASCRNNRP